MSHEAGYSSHCGCLYKPYPSPFDRDDMIIAEQTEKTMILADYFLFETVF
jgi:hypothetical protein